MYSFSSCWNSHRHTDGRAMLREIRSLGFEHAELSHGIRISLLPGIVDAVEAGEMRISSLHNFCPLPIGVNHPAPNLFQFTAASDRERENAFRYTVKTMDMAVRLKAPLVVLHMGSIEMKDYTEHLKSLLGQGLKASSKYQKLADEASRKREEKKEKPVQRAGEVLRRLVTEASSRGLKLGIENREALEEIPLEGDSQFFFREFSDPCVTYWHDTGHAQIKENLGFIHHRLQLESLSDRLSGFHIHDVQFPAQDHCAPGSGMIDFLALKSLVRPDHIKVFELSPALSEEQVRAGVAHLREIWGGD